MVGDIVSDKDGVSALAVMAQLATHLYARQSTLSDFLADAYNTYFIIG